ncbi:copper resistance protein B [Sphingomonas sp. OV641]|uniref:copper resistance protein B n=1 Tax=Sphingomonas sp. OV641 TaxID=1881068 RepID=UPI0008D7C443|nr:copper resistance protein B [Sphingomonas sp. OV641]SEJ35759.1 copper resistance protein B [Sphingomonas sp. OV641]
MIALLLATAALAGSGAPAQAADHQHHSHGSAPAPAPVKPAPSEQPAPSAPSAKAHGAHHAAPDTPAVPVDTSCTPEHAAMGHCSLKTAETRPNEADDAPAGTALAAGHAPAPAAPDATYADRVWGADAMSAGRATLRQEHGGMSFAQVMLNLAEVQIRDGADGYRWDGEFWYGGDVNRLTVKTEGEGTFGSSAGGEVQALYSRAVGPYFNLQAGLRQDVGSGPSPTYAAIGVEGLAPYWFDVEGAVFLSDDGDAFARLEGYYDQRITQRLILQPRAEFNLSAQDVPYRRLGSGLTDAEAGLRLRYEIVREFAPYVGVSWERQFGDTARFSRANGDDTGGFSFVAGIRAWF